MTVILIGLNHRTAPVELRERLAFAGDTLHSALGQLHSLIPHFLHEGAILSTCNRLELYAVVDDAVQGWQALEQFLVRSQGIALERLRPHLYFVMGQAAAEHLMRVAAGLDSMVLGEAQILGQVADAFHAAQTAGTAGPILSRLFAQAIHAGKRAHTETVISRHTTSISHAAAQLIEAEIAGLTAANVLIVGAGTAAETAALALRDKGAQFLTIVNRTYANAEALADKVSGRVFGWEHLAQGLAWADVVVSATSATHPVIHVAQVQEVLPLRKNRPLLFVDIAVPRDVDEAVDNLPGVRRYDIDDLQSAIDGNLAQRQSAIAHVEAIIAEEQADFTAWLHSREVAPVISDLRRKAESLVNDEVEAALNRLEGLDPQAQRVINQLAHRIVNKLLHEPTVRLKAHAANGSGENYAHAVRDLFALNEAATPTEYELHRPELHLLVSIYPDSPERAANE